MIGVLSSLPKGKQFGFIKVEGDKKEYFFHRDDFSGHWDDLDADFYMNPAHIIMEFDIVESVRGPRAANVKRLDYPNQ